MPIQRVNEIVSAQIGNTLTNIQTWSGVIYNVKSYGANGDGSTDDTGAIQAAIADAVSAGGGSILFPKGEYQIRDNITIPENVTAWFMSGAKLNISSGKTVTINGPVVAGHYQIFMGDGTVAGNMKVDFVYPQWWGAVGDGDESKATQNTSAFQKAIDFCIENGKAMYIPRTGSSMNSGGYILNGTLNIRRPIFIDSDPTSLLNWENITSGIGINIDYGDWGGHKGTYRFGILQGNKSFFYPGATLPSGQYGTAVRIANGDHVNFYAKYISFWDTGILVEATESRCENGVIEFDVIDDCQKGILIKGSNGFAVHVTKVVFNTIGIAKYPIFLQTDGVSGSAIDSCVIEGCQLFSEYPNGSCIYADSSSGIIKNKFFIASMAANNTPISNQKTGGSTFRNPFISGTATVNGESGFFFGHENRFEVGFNEGEAAGRPIRVKISGTNNVIHNINQAQKGTLGFEVIPSSIQGEGNFDGGVGSASLSNKIFCQITLPSDLSSGSESTFYVYSQLISNYVTGIKVIPYSFYNADLDVWAENNWPVNREIRIRIKNKTNTPAGYTFKFMLEIY